VVTITSEDGRAEQTLDIDVPKDAERLVLVGADGWEYHFGSRTWRDRFAHVATYTPAKGRERYVWWWQVMDGLEKEWEVREGPELGPRLDPLVERALRSLLDICNLNNGFVGPTEKQFAVEHLRAVWHEGGVGFRPDEVAVWAATHGWTIKDAKDLRGIAEGVREGTRFRSAGRAIRRDPARERRMIAAWREELAA
jgi:hypothetical protein